MGGNHKSGNVRLSFVCLLCIDLLMCLLFQPSVLDNIDIDYNALASLITNRPADCRCGAIKILHVFLWLVTCYDISCCLICVDDY
jgi:hypothetical protein